MATFITGATGFIGSELTLKLAKAGQQIHAFYRSEAKRAALKHENIKLFKGDLLDADSIEQAMKGCDTVYHLAAYANLWARDPQLFHRINFEATKQILWSAQKLGVKKMVVTSTAGVLGPSTQGVVDENTVREVDFFSEYEETKWLAEQFIKDFDAKGMEIVLVNPTRVFGPGLLSKSNSVTTMVHQYINGRFRFIPGSGECIGNYVFIDDVVKGHLLAMEKGKHGERFLLGGESVSFNNFFKTLSEVSGKQYHLFKVPIALLLFAARIMQWRADKFGKPPLITPKWVRRFTLYDWVISSQKAERELGYQITPLSSGLKKTVDWLNTK